MVGCLEIFGRAIVHPLVAIVVSHFGIERLLFGVAHLVAAIHFLFSFKKIRYIKLIQSKILLLFELNII